MSYGILFVICAGLLTAIAAIQQGYFILLLWPSLSFAIVAAGYLHFGPIVYQKSEDGLLSPISKVFLLPYLLFLWAIWHIARLVKAEPPFNQLTEKIWIGRRLLAHELLNNIDHVIDLTCEFEKSHALLSYSYHSYPILDGVAPAPQQLYQWVREVNNLPGNLYIHCAEGHGRTGLFSALLLLQKGYVNTVEEAIALIQTKRPLVKLRNPQLTTLWKAHHLLQLRQSSEAKSL